jgi:hypothetical protein
MQHISFCKFDFKEGSRRNPNKNPGNPNKKRVFVWINDPKA